jgi:hypothetical protein
LQETKVRLMVLETNTMQKRRNSATPTSLTLRVSIPGAYQRAITLRSDAGASRKKNRPHPKDAGGSRGGGLI